MKKIIPILLCLLLVTALALSVSAEGSSATITPSATTLERGGTFTVEVELADVKTVNLCTVVLSFDTNVFEFVDGTCAFANAAYSKVDMTDKGVAGTMLLGSMQDVSGKVFVVNFKVKADAVLGAYDITPTVSVSGAAVTEISAEKAAINVVCVHTYGEWTKVDEDKHQKVCSKCQDVQPGDHNWNDGEGDPAPDCENGGTTKFTCKDCKATKTAPAEKLGHVWDNDCDTRCNRVGCDETREPKHDYASTYSSDKDNHWYTCSTCGDKKGSAAHTPGAAATEKAPQTCTTCGYEIAPIIAHVHNFGNQMMTDSEYHWKYCVKDGCNHVEGRARHTYDNACDVSCNDCDYIRSDVAHNFMPELQAGVKGHWHICSECNAKSEVVAHTPGPEATETEPQRCTECNFIIKMELSHEHNFGEQWYSDEESHWQTCSGCVEVTAMAEHEWDEGEEQTDGSIRYTCTVCAREVTHTKPLPSEPQTTPPTTQPAKPTAPKPTQPADSEETGTPVWKWAGIAAIVLLVIGIILLVIEFIRSRKKNMHGKFSK